jgi:hypothetical protein
MNSRAGRPPHPQDECVLELFLRASESHNGYSGGRYSGSWPEDWAASWIEVSLETEAGPSFFPGNLRFAGVAARETIQIVWPSWTGLVKGTMLGLEVGD